MKPRSVTRVPAGVESFLIDDHAGGHGYLSVGELMAVHEARLQDKPAEKHFFATRHLPIEFSAASIMTILRALAAEIPDIFSGSILEIGACRGNFTRELSRFSSRVLALDLSAESLRDCRNRAPAARCSVADGERLPFPGKTFSLVIMNGVIHHFHNPGPLLRECHRVLQDGGHLYAIEPHLFGPWHYLFRNRRSPLYISSGVSPNEQPVAAAPLRDCLETAGFAITTLKPLNGITFSTSNPSLRLPVWGYNLFAGLLRTLWPRFPLSDYLAVEARAIHRPDA